MNTTPLTYLDYAATSPLKPEVITAMTKIMTEVYGNPSSLHAAGREASKILREQRQDLAAILQTNPSRIYFTSGGTESNNMAIKGYALAHQNKGKHIITSSMEHHSVLDTVAYLEERFGFEVTYLQPNADGLITRQEVAEALRPDTILVSLIWVNNETGHINPIADIGNLLAEHQAAFHVDGVQGVGKLPISPDDWQIDFLSASAHKFHGPKGVGFLYSREHQLDKLLHGGDQESKRRASTENLTGIVGLVTALGLAYGKMADAYDHAQTLKNHLISQLPESSYYLNSSEQGLPQVINLGLIGQNNAHLLTRLDLDGIAVSTGSACTAGNVEPSHVLAALYGTDSPKLRENIRISTSSLTTAEDIDKLASILKKIIG